ncbi:hypothetical protein GOP47_0010988 [Adiantum capillus-veneris]|uniref:E2F-associated phosphoprotein n=2 Tax=Adiantum capillus-veneris TaxID=13818 RepID=A0A9D4UX62_ADICA|nr:hypothetical protein GOP47_0010988 [Adiantum capillus-veneris]
MSAQAGPLATQKSGSSTAGPVNFSDSSNDELDETPPEFYDATMDDRDQAWAERKRKGRKSDALLSCPACFTTLCMDCQRHDKIVTQYRAMFVLNCKIIEGQSRQFNVNGKKRKRKAKTTGGQSFHEEESIGETYQPVACSVCGTEVAVFDQEEVYHFYNVLPSFV